MVDHGITLSTAHTRWSNPIELNSGGNDAHIIAEAKADENKIQAISTIE
jgi:hypothetical protein